MRIKITESQAEKLKLIKENVTPIDTFNQFCIKLNTELNKVYTKIISMSVEEVMQNKETIDRLVDLISSYEDKLYSEQNKAYSYIENMPDDGSDALIDKMYDKPSDKLTSISLILTNLSKIADITEEHNLNKSFDDNKPIDITSNQIS